MKYNPDFIKKIEKFTKELTSDSSNFWKHCSIHHIACLLGVHRDTIYEWQKKFPEFSDTIKKWEEKRNACFLELRQKNASWIFLAKNWLGMSDKQEVQQTTEFKPLKVIISKETDTNGK